MNIYVWTIVGRPLIHCVAEDDTDVAHYNFNSHHPISKFLSELLLRVHYRMVIRRPT